jgi:poly(3-hydroxybutyrate) depolymerase
MPAYLIPICTDTVPIPLIVFQGTDDAVIPWTGVPSAYLSAAQTIGYWGNHNHCTGEFVVESMPNTDPADYTVVMRQVLTECEADMTLYGIYFGGHTWPGHPLDPSLQLGQTTNDIDATALTWEFFEAHVNTFEAD